MLISIVETYQERDMETNSINTDQRNEKINSVSMMNPDSFLFPYPAALPIIAGVKFVTKPVVYVTRVSG